MKQRHVFSMLTIGLVLCCLGACSRKAEMCARCHMALKSGSIHETEITYADGTIAKFDSAVCAITVWQHPPPGAVPKSMTLHEYYSGKPRDASEVMFVHDSDVTGPMGNDFIAVDESNVKKFEADHGGKEFRLRDIKLDGSQEQSL
ncbi:MAG: nitrous oxide reductase accessory protein NosL [Polyangiaceae bacterium]